MFGAPAGGGLFGGAAPAAGGGMFGAPATGGGLFGAAPAAGGGMFGGAAPAAGGGMFGAPATGGGLFGGAAPAAGGGMFGAPATTGGGLFGAAPAAGGGMFGAAPAAGGGMFGAAPAGGGMFGAPAAADPNAMESNFKQIGEQFAQAYFQAYDSNRQGLAQFYEAQSLFTFEGECVQGTQQITQKLTTLPFQQVQHQVSSCHCQPVPGSPDKVILLVTGAMLVNGSQNVKFTQLFQLMKKPQTGSWFILNDAFKVIQ